MLSRIEILETEIEELEEEASDEVETTGSMSQYVNALKTQIKS